MKPRPLPPKNMRRCGAAFHSNHQYCRSALQEAGRILSRPSEGAPRILDIGSGVGRLATGLHWHPRSDFTYTGIDIDQKAIDWANVNLATDDGRFLFEHVDLHNARYNPGGKIKMDQSFMLPYPDNSFDIIYLYSVFTHMIEPEVKLYLREFARLLNDEDSFVFLTAHLEPNVQKAQSNPPGYPPWPWYKGGHDGPLHVARYDRDHFTKMARIEDLKVLDMGHLDEWNWQSSCYLGIA